MCIIYTVHTPPPVGNPWGPAPCGPPRVCTLVPFIYSEAMVITDATVAISNSVATQNWMIRLFQNMPRGWTLLNRESPRPRGWIILTATKSSMDNNFLHVDMTNHNAEFKISVF